MKTNRRGFFKVLGAGAIVPAVVKRAEAKEAPWVPVDDVPQTFEVVETWATAASTPSFTYRNISPPSVEDES